MEKKTLGKELDTIKDDFKRIKKLFVEEEELDLYEHINQISFIESKLNVLKVGIEDREEKRQCRELIKDIHQFKEEVDFHKYNEKLSLVKELEEITGRINQLGQLDIEMALNRLMDIVIMEEEDIENLFRNNLVYVNDTDNNYSPVKQDQLEKLAYAKEALVCLFDFVITSYNKSNKPFDVYEKIIILNTLDSIAEYIDRE